MQSGSSESLINKPEVSKSKQKHGKKKKKSTEEFKEIMKGTSNLTNSKSLIDLSSTQLVKGKYSHMFIPHSRDGGPYKSDSQLTIEDMEHLAYLERYRNYIYGRTGLTKDFHKFPVVKFSLGHFRPIYKETAAPFLEKYIDHMKKNARKKHDRKQCLSDTDLVRLFKNPYSHYQINNQENYRSETNLNKNTTKLYSNRSFFNRIYSPRKIFRSSKEERFNSKENFSHESRSRTSNKQAAASNDFGLSVQGSNFAINSVIHENENEEETESTGFERQDRSGVTSYRRSTTSASGQRSSRPESRPEGNILNIGGPDFGVIGSTTVLHEHASLHQSRPSSVLAGNNNRDIGRLHNSDSTSSLRSVSSTRSIRRRPKGNRGDALKKLDSKLKNLLDISESVLEESSPETINLQDSKSMTWNEYRKFNKAIRKAKHENKDIKKLVDENPDLKEKWKKLERLQKKCGNKILDESKMKEFFSKKGQLMEKKVSELSVFSADRMGVIDYAARLSEESSLEGEDVISDTDSFMSTRKITSKVLKKSGSKQSLRNIEATPYFNVYQDEEKDKKRGKKMVEDRKSLFNEKVKYKEHMKGGKHKKGDVKNIDFSDSEHSGMSGMMFNQEEGFTDDNSESGSSVSSKNQAVKIPKKRNAWKQGLMRRASKEEYQDYTDRPWAFLDDRKGLVWKKKQSDDWDMEEFISVKYGKKKGGNKNGEEEKSETSSLKSVKDSKSKLKIKDSKIQLNKEAGQEDDFLRRDSLDGVKQNIHYYRTEVWTSRLKPGLKPVIKEKEVLMADSNPGWIYIPSPMAYNQKINLDECERVGVINEVYNAIDSSSELSFGDLNYVSQSNSDPANECSFLDQVLEKPSGIDDYFPYVPLLKKEKKGKKKKGKKAKVLPPPIQPPENLCTYEASTESSKNNINIMLVRARGDRDLIEVKERVKRWEAKQKHKLEKEPWLKGRMSFNKQVCRFGLPCDMLTLKNMTPSEYLMKFCFLSERRVRHYMDSFNKIIAARRKANKNNKLKKQSEQEESASRSASTSSDFNRQTIEQSMDAGEKVAQLAHKAKFKLTEEEMKKTVSIRETIQGVMEVHQGYVSENQMDDLFTMLQIRECENPRVKSELFMSLCALTERLFFSKYADKQDPRIVSGKEAAERLKIEVADFDDLKMKLQGIELQPCLMKLLTVLKTPDSP